MNLKLRISIGFTYGFYILETVLDRLSPLAKTGYINQIKFTVGFQNHATWCEFVA